MRPEGGKPRGDPVGKEVEHLVRGGDPVRVQVLRVKPFRRCAPLELVERESLPLVIVRVSMCAPSEFRVQSRLNPPP